MQPKIIINADDFGWKDGQNLAVERAHCEGILDRASLLANGDAFEQAVEMSKRMPQLQVGVHLSLNEGKPVLADRGSVLVRDDGRFWDTVPEIVSLWIKGKLRKADVIPEWRQQIQRVFDHGISPVHLDSHKHVHTIPPLLQATLELAREYNIPYVRVPQERISLTSIRRGPAALCLWGLAGQARKHISKAGLRHSSRFVGISISGRMTAERLIKHLQTSYPHTVEIMVHPAIETPDIIKLRQQYRWAKDYLFEEELEALCRKDIIALKERMAVPSAGQ